MLSRCYNPKNEAWKRYGGRGIAVSDEWNQSFHTFWNDMSPTYRPGLCLERRNNAKGYSKQNCYWASRQQQNQNKRTNRYIQTPWGKLCVAEAARRAGINVQTLHGRLNSGYPRKKLFEKPK